MGLRFEHHEFETDDHFPIGLTRIPRKKTNAKTAILFHGLADSSATFCLSGREKSWSSFLYDHGFDVWLLDSRGRAASFKNAFLKNENVASGWNFTVDHKIDHDFPSAVDYVLKKTKRKSITVALGHSQGGLVVIASAARHDLKIDKLVALAPPLGGWSSHRYIPVPKAETLHALLGAPSKVARNVRTVVSVFCANFETICAHVMCFVSGCRDPYDLVNKPSQILSYYPTATSFANVAHLMECEKRGHACRRFERDYKYPWKKVAHKTALVYGTGDRIVDLETRAKPSVALIKAAYTKYVDGYGHGDLIWAESARREVMLPLLNNFL